ncbi:hypothetical protein GDO86_019344 [Hymenochirus boettgeri]|uniref:Uncharacterized protein n=1 Tax=Hymenochirus boettgeri TaxID=247094 RepID=A0A8T2IDT8_9PIPI|nr:hypothetical protein GDO86_019344 [Hymenochirus boettgeri]
MADNMAELSVKDVGKKAEMELPPPPLLDSAPHPTEAESQEELFMPLPPPKESFSKFYEQRQVNELKRLYRHMHPELRKNLEHSVNSEISDLLKPDDPCQQAPVSLDTSLTGEVQSMRWIFENWNLDAIGEHQGSKKLTEEETVLGGNVKDTSMRFQGQINVGSDNLESIGKDQSKGDVKTALWLFETQPLDSMNKIYPADADVHEVVLKESIERGDVKGTKFLFETCSLDEVGRCNSVEEHNILQLKSEIQELKGDVKKTVKLFQTEPLCAIRDNSGNIHKIKNVCREETESNQVNTTRWLFETQPLDTIHKDSINVQIIRGISLEDIEKGGVNATKWIFETQPLDTIKELTDEMCFQASSDTHDKDRSSKQLNQKKYVRLVSVSDVQKGNVRTSSWLFENQPIDSLKGESEEHPGIIKVQRQDNQRGDVKRCTWLFESQPLDSLRDAETPVANLDKEILKGDVKSFKNLFETLPWILLRGRVACSLQPRKYTGRECKSKSNFIKLYPFMP